MEQSLENLISQILTEEWKYMDFSKGSIAVSNRNGKYTVEQMRDIILQFAKLIYLRCGVISTTKDPMLINKCNLVLNGYQDLLNKWYSLEEYQGNGEMTDFLIRTDSALIIPDKH